MPVSNAVANQKATPAIYASSLATRPAFGFVGRIFVDTDSPSTGLYRDTGTAWIQIADPGAGTTGTLQQVTTNGKTTNQGIIITAGALTLGTTSGDNQTLLNLPATNTLIYRENVGSLYGFNIGTSDNSFFLTNSEGQYYQTLYFGDGITTNIFGISASNDSGVTNNAILVVNQDSKVGINTNTPGVALDIHSSVNVIAQINQTTATNNSLLSFQNSNVGLWRIGNFYNSAANDFGIFDIVNSLQPLTIKKLTGQTFIGTETTSSGALVINNATTDNHIVCIGANAPSIRLRNTGTAPTLNVGFGISTATNNFIQGSASGNYCIFNSSSTASPILFGVYDAGIGNTQEAVRISAARNLLVGIASDSGYKLDINGTGRFSGAATFSSSVTADRVLTANKTNNSTLVAGSIEIQSYALNNSWLGDNMYFNGAGFYARNTGYTSQIYFQTNGDMNFFTSPSTVTAGSVTNTALRFSIASNGIVNIANTPIYATNALALAGGLVAGDIYKSATGVLSIVY